MRKLVSVLMILGVAFSVSACKEAPVPPSYDYDAYKISENLTDGTYKEVAKGRNGDFEVEVVIKEGKIADILIGENMETVGKGDLALEEVRALILENNSPNVDGVTGATFSSFALRDAVSKALEKASV